jgi:hypothetical protein
MKYSALVLTLILATTGCDRSNSSNSIPTFSRQIVDLVDAHESGVITTDEYNELRERLMRTMLR